MRFSHCELLFWKVIAEAGDSLGTRRKVNISRSKPVTSNGSEDVTVDCCVCDTEL
jgi:hypothetical protein